MWRSGEKQPVLIYKDDKVDHFDWSPDGKYFMFRNGMSAESQIHLVDARSGDMTDINCFIPNDGDTVGTPFFSPDSKSIIFSGIEHSPESKTISGIGHLHNISILNTETKQIKVLVQPSENADYSVVGWSGEDALLYKKKDEKNKTEELLEYTFIKD